MTKINPHDEADDIVRTRIGRQLKQKAQEILQDKGVSVSDYLRESLVRLVDAEELPFPVRTRTSVIAPEVRKRLVNRNLPELHATRWAETTAQLEAAIAGEEAKRAPDRAKLATLERELSGHYANRFKPETSRAALLGEQTKKRGGGR